MALTPMGDFSFNHVDNVDKPNKSATQNKTDWDSRGAELKTALNAAIAKLNAVTDGASGADNVAMTPIAETGANATVQSIVEALITRLKAVTDSASGADLIGATAITQTGTAATTQAILEALAPMTTQGDITYQGASAPARLAKGTAGQVLEMNPGATAPQWGNTKLDEHKAETTPHAELTNRTITVGVGKDFATIQAAINSIKKRVEAKITVQVDAGTYAEDVVISGFAGSGEIDIRGGTDLATAANYQIISLLVKNCNLYLNVTGFKATGAGLVFGIHSNATVSFNYCTSVSTGTCGFYVSSGLAMLEGCSASNKTYALISQVCSTVRSKDWTAGSGNTVGIYCSSAATVGKEGTQPQGTTAENTASGGVIR